MAKSERYKRTNNVAEEAGVPEREPPNMDKQLVSFITCGCESSGPFCNL